jgi:2',3'-cyclic-nucleotide 2'-phosphodiesterase (5'-nucleotidase family)
MNNISAPLYTVNHSAGALPAGAARGSEVVTFDAARGLLFVVGAEGVDALRVADGSLAFSLPRSAVLAPGGGAAPALGTGNSAALSGDRLAIAFDGGTPGTNGYVAIFTLDAAGASASWTASFEVGVVPDMVTFTPDGSRLLVAIEGEPTAGYATDAPGGLTLIDLADASPANWTATFFGFEAFDAQADALRAAGVKLNTAIPGSPGYNTALPSLDLEPEYIALAPDGGRAFVTLQENNAIGVFNLDPAKGAVGWTAVLPLGLVDHSLAGNSLDGSDRDGGAHFRNAPVFGLRQPDALAAFEMGGRLYLITANEGDGREYGGAFNEEVRINALLSGNTGNTPAAGMPPLDPALAAILRANSNQLLSNAELGRLQISRWSGDTDNDGDLDQLHVIGGRSFSIFEVGGTDAAPTITLVFDSGDFIDRTVAALLPQGFDDTRSDNKGAEPEHVTLGTIDGQLYAFIGLERANANMMFRIDSPTDVTFQGFIARSGDVAPETTAFIPASIPVNGAVGDARLAVANEVSRTTTLHDITVGGTPGNFTLQILHASDFEAGLLATGRAAQFAAIVDRLEDQFVNSITLSSGDNFIPGPFAAAATDGSVVPVLRAFYEQLLGLASGTLTSLNGSSAPFFAADIAILNAIGIQASVLGNHEFDLGTNALAAAIDFVSNTTGATPGARVTNIGAQFPYLSANLTFAGDANLANLFTTTLRDAASFATTAADLASNDAVAAENADRQIAPWTVIHENGEKIGVLGVTTQILGQITTVDGVRVLDPAGDGGVNNVAELAGILQPLVDQMTGLGLNKIILLSHLQQFQLELQLAPLLRGVDVIIAGGSHAVFANPDDALLPGNTAAQPYPAIRTGADGNPVLIVNTDGEFSYVGRLVVEFDANGVIDTTALDPALNGPIAATDAHVAALWGSDDPYAEGTRGGEVKKLTDAIQNVITAKDGNVFGFTDVFLDGRRSEVRTEETNLGNLTADANLFVARQLDPGVMLSIKNGGGIRAEIGAIRGQPVPQELPPLANPGAGKPTGGVSQLDIENSLRFNNSLVKLDVTAANLERIFEHAVAGSTPTNTPGAFPQIGGAAFSFDLSRPAQVLVTDNSGPTPTLSDTAPGGVVGQRIQSLVLYNDDGSVADVIMQNGVFQGDPNRVISLVTLNFLANPGSNPLLGGDGYPFPAFTIPGSRVNLLNHPDLPAGVAGFAAPGSEQDALAEFLAARHGVPEASFQGLDTPRAEDLRIQNLAFRADTVGDPLAQVTIGLRSTLLPLEAGPAGFDFSFTGGSASETIRVHETDDRVIAGGGDDTVFGGAGHDLLAGGNGADVLEGGSGDDSLFGHAGNDTLRGGDGNDLLNGGAGADVMEGGLGDDTYIVTDAADTIIEAAGGGRDVVRASVSVTLAENVEDLVFFTAGNTGIGNAARNLLRGSLGSDTLDGAGGHDVLVGGGGADVLIGGAGRDIFAYFAFSDSAPGESDLIGDFEQGFDRIDLRRIDASADPGDQAFAFVGGGAFAGGGQGSVRFTFSGGETLVEVDAGDGGAAEMVIRLTGNVNLTAADFLL